MKSRCRVVLTHLKRSGGARQRHRFFFAPSEPETSAKGAPSLTFQARTKRKANNSERVGSQQDQLEDDEVVVFTNNGDSSSGNGSSANSSPRCPRRVVLLCDGEDSEVQRVLLEYRGTEISGKRLHADVQRLAAEHRGSYVAAEWLGPLGWTRFLWCRLGPS
jgi:hypothetical protein